MGLVDYLHIFEINKVYNCCRFQMTYGDRALTALPYAMNSEFSKVLAAQMVSELCTEKKCFGPFSLSYQKKDAPCPFPFQYDTNFRTLGYDTS